MNPRPTGQIVRTAAGFDIVVARRIHGSVQDVWASITDSDRTARWFGRWEGEPAPGAMLRLQLGFEEGQPWCDVRVDSCDPPQHLGVTTVNPDGDWPLEVSLEEQPGYTELTLLHHRATLNGAGEIGPGWEYYLDNLVASREGHPLPAFESYYPSMQQHYQDQAAAATDNR